MNRTIIPRLLFTDGGQTRLLRLQGIDPVLRRQRIRAELAERVFLVPFFRVAEVVVGAAQIAQAVQAAGEFFNLILETQLGEAEKQDLAAFLKCL